MGLCAFTIVMGLLKTLQTALRPWQGGFDLAALWSAWIPHVGRSQLGKGSVQMDSGR